MEPEQPNKELHDCEHCCPAMIGTCHRNGYVEHCGEPMELWGINCCLCHENGKFQGRLTKHRPWHCRKYPTPQKARERLRELYRCIECGMDSYHERVHHECVTTLIEEYNYGACGQCDSDLSLIHISEPTRPY